jgi:hypothetical protein
VRIRVFLLLAAAFFVTASVAQAATVRMFAVGNKQRVADAVSYQAYRDKMSALMDKGFPNRGSLVQPGVDDVASHVRPADPNAPSRALAVFPEDVGLVAALIGSRGAVARRQTSTDFAIISLFGPYAPQTTYYANKFPGLIGIRTLSVALTDTLYRSFYETFRDLAIKHKVYIAAAMNAPPARRVEASDDPGLVALLRDPDEPQRTYAYEAVSQYPANATYLFAPDGQILVPDGKGGTLESPRETGGVIGQSVKKAYLTPPEQPPPGELLGLSLGFGPVRDMDVLDTPVGRLGIVISKDAWMMDVNDRFATKGANVILQPEAFSDWAFVPRPWAPDTFKAGGFANLQKLPEFRFNIDASMTGNFVSAAFDGQSVILSRKRKVPAGPLRPDNAFIGQNPDTGFIRIAPWIEPDPGIANPSLTLAQRRAQLAADGSKLLAGTPCPTEFTVGPCQNGYRESIVWSDLRVPGTRTLGAVDRTRKKPPSFSWSVPVDDREEGSRELRSHWWKRSSGRDDREKVLPGVARAPQVAAVGSHVYVVWHESRGDRLPKVWLAVSRNGGRSFRRPVRVSSNAEGSVEELHPSVAADQSQVVVAWQEFASARDDDRGRIELARFDPRGRKLRVERVDDSDMSGKWLPAVALSGGTPVVAWIDERDTGPEGEPLEHVYAARANDAGAGFRPSVRVDAGAPVALALHIDNKWAPAIATAGAKVFLTWADFRNYNWEIFGASSGDGGRSWGANTRVDDFLADERLNERPTVAFGPNGTLHAAWTDLRAREPDTNVFYARSGDLGATFSTPRQLDDSRVGSDPDRDTPSNQWHPSLAAAGDRLFAAWQDNRLGNNDIFFSQSADAGATFGASERADDTGAGQSEQTRPRLTWADGTCYAVWEDDRTGASAIYLGRRSCPLP